MNTGKSKSVRLLSRAFVFSFLLLISYAVNGQGKSKNQGRWHDSDKVEDSDFSYIKKAGIHYSISNDINNIYLYLVFDDAKAQKMIFRNGLIIWIDMDGKSLKKTGIRYPMGIDYQGNRRKAYITDSDNTSSESKNNQQATLNTIELVGFTGETERHFSADNPDNFRGSVNMNTDGKMYYQLIMPLSKLAMRNSKESGGAMPFSMGIEYGFSYDNYEKGTASGSAATYDYNSGGSRNGTNIKRKPGGTIKPGKYNKPSGTSSSVSRKNQKSSQGSELFWLKDVRLATSK